MTWTSRTTSICANTGPIHTTTTSPALPDTPEEIALPDAAREVLGRRGQAKVAF